MKFLKHFKTQWYWVILKLLILVAIGIIGFDLVVNVVEYLRPQETLPEVQYQKPLGLFAPIFYGIEKGLSFMKPFMHFLQLVLAVIEVFILFFLMIVSLSVFREQRGSSIVFMIFSGLWISSYFPLDEVNQTPIGVELLIPIGIIGVALFALLKKEPTRMLEDANPSEL